METSFLAYKLAALSLETKTVVSCPLLKFLQAMQQLTFNDNLVWRTVANLMMFHVVS